jgi:regulatory protein
MSDHVSDPLAARKKAMDFLARREYGHTELIEKLEKAGFDTDISEGAVAALSEDGLQSDRRFAEAFVASRVNQGKGPVRIRAELRERRLADAVIDAALDEAGTDWNELARTVRTRKFGARLPADFASKAKQMRFLQYRGFEPDQVRAAVSTTDD